MLATSPEINTMKRLSFVGWSYDTVGGLKINFYPCYSYVVRLCIWTLLLDAALRLFQHLTPTDTD